MLKPDGRLLGAAPLGRLTRCATPRARSACWRARSAACARCATIPGSGRDPLHAGAGGGAARGARRAGRAACSAADSLRALAGAAAPARARLRRARARPRSAVTVGGDRLLAGRQRCSTCSVRCSAQLMSDGVATRLLDSEGKVDRAKASRPTPSACPSCTARLTREVWSELGAARRHSGAAPRAAARACQPPGGDAAAARRAARADRAGLLRAQARALLARIDAAQRAAPASSAEARAHLADSAETLAPGAGRAAAARRRLSQRGARRAAAGARLPPSGPAKPCFVAPGALARATRRSTALSCGP